MQRNAFHNLNHEKLSCWFQTRPKCKKSKCLKILNKKFSKPCYQIILHCNAKYAYPTDWSQRNFGRRIRTCTQQGFPFCPVRNLGMEAQCPHVAILTSLVGQWACDIETFPPRLPEITYSFACFLLKF